MFNLQRPAGDSLFARATTAIRLACQNLMRLQHSDGWWCGELHVDSTLCSDFILFMHWSGDVDRVLQEKCVAHILARQQRDGGWNIFHDGPAEISASVKAYFALKLAGHEPQLAHMREARSCILRLGGIPRMNTYAKLYLALLGQFPWKWLPCIPVEFILFPRWFVFNIYEMSSWSRAMLIPLAIIHHFKPTRTVPPECAIHELYPVGTEQGFLGVHQRGLWTWRNFFLCCDRVLKAVETLPWKPLRSLALRRAEAWMLERMGAGSEGLAAIFPAMLNALVALKALGRSETDPIVQKARKDFEGLFVDDPNDFRIQPCLSAVWDTAINLVALNAAKETEHLRELAPGIQRALAWLKQKEVRTRGDWAVKNPKVSPSGWAFEFENYYYPDTDDTMMVLMALANEPASHVEGTEENVQFTRALTWLLSFQCRNGGWAAFDKDITQHWLEDVPFADHNAILDPPCSDLTGRMLELLGRLGWPRENMRVWRAIQFLRATQDEDGSWWGRWGVNYVYGTWQVLRGLRAIGEDMRQPWIIRARDWLQSAQNEDGGWGETCASYEDARLKGRGPSTASQTAWGLMGLMAAALPTELDAAIGPIQKAAEWLLATQNADGSWTEPETTGTGFPGVFYLRYDMYRNNWPLLALSTWRDTFRHTTTGHGQTAEGDGKTV